MISTGGLRVNQHLAKWPALPNVDRVQSIGAEQRTKYSERSARYVTD